MIGLFNDPSKFGRVPDPPEPFECTEIFNEDICCMCSNYEECSRYYMEEEDYE